MKYCKVWRSHQNIKQDITYDEALKLTAEYWHNESMAADMLSIPNVIECGMYYVTSEDEEGLVLMAGLYNMLPL